MVLFKYIWFLGNFHFIAFRRKQLTVAEKEIVIDHSVSFYCSLFSEWQAIHYLFSRIKSEPFDLSTLGSQECRWDSSTEVVYGSLSPATKPVIRSALPLCVLLWIQSKWSLDYHCKEEQERKHGKRRTFSQYLFFPFLMFKF